MNVELVEENRSSDTMNDHGDLTVLVERNFQEFFDILDEQANRFLIAEMRDTHLSVGDHIHVTETVRVRVRRTKTKSHSQQQWSKPPESSLFAVPAEDIVVIRPLLEPI